MCKCPLSDLRYSTGSPVFIHHANPFPQGGQGLGSQQNYSQTSQACKSKFPASLASESWKGGLNRMQYVDGSRHSNRVIN